MTTVHGLAELKALAGTDLGAGGWLEVSQGRIDTFADATGDHQWIHVDVERAAAGPFDGTIAHGDEVCALAWLNPAEAGRVLGAVPEARGKVVHSAALAEHLAAALAALNGDAGSAARIEWLVVLAEPASLDAGEITDKGYVNQRRVLACRATLVERLYGDPASDEVIAAARTHA